MGGTPRCHPLHHLSRHRGNTVKILIVVKDNKPFPLGCGRDKKVGELR